MAKFKDAMSELRSAKAKYNHNCMVWLFCSKNQSENKFSLQPRASNCPNVRRGKKNILLVYIVGKKFHNNVSVLQMAEEELWDPLSRHIP